MVSGNPVPPMGPPPRRPDRGGPLSSQPMTHSAPLPDKPTMNARDPAPLRLAHQSTRTKPAEVPQRPPKPVYDLVPPPETPLRSECASNRRRQTRAQGSGRCSLTTSGSAIRDVDERAQDAMFHVKRRGASDAPPGSRRSNAGDPHSTPCDRRPCEVGQPVSRDNVPFGLIASARKPAPPPPSASRGSG
jgi:hypothetical protein